MSPGVEILAREVRNSVVAPRLLFGEEQCGTGCGWSAGATQQVFSEW